MKDELDINELLNGFIDGELTERQKTEVQRLISHDPQIAKHLQQLQKCRMLVSSLSYEEAPDDMAEQVQASLERKALLEEQHIAVNERKGARQLMFRRVLAAAAMIGLVAVLATIIYTIVTPGASQSAIGFKGRLELKTGNLLVTNTVIDTAIKNNGLEDSATVKHQRNKNIYTLTCSREKLIPFLAKLNNSWEWFDSSTLYVETQIPQEHVIVTDVDTKQIVDLITPPKPRLTGVGENSVEPPKQVQSEKKIRLTIVVTGSKSDN